MSGALSMNQVILLGRVGSFNAATVGSGGDRVFNINLATTRTWFSANGEKKEATTWAAVVAWRALADVCERYVRKGSLILVVGELNNRRYTNREGDEVYATEVTAQRVFCLRDLLQNSQDRESSQDVIVSAGEGPTDHSP